MDGGGDQVRKILGDLGHGGSCVDTPTKKRSGQARA